MFDETPNLFMIISKNNDIIREFKHPDKESSQIRAVVRINEWTPEMGKRGKRELLEAVPSFRRIDYELFFSSSSSIISSSVSIFSNVGM